MCRTPSSAVRATPASMSLQRRSRRFAVMLYPMVGQNSTWPHRRRRLHRMNNIYPLHCEKPHRYRQEIPSKFIICFCRRRFATRMADSAPSASNVECSGSFMNFKRLKPLCAPKMAADETITIAPKNAYGWEILPLPIIFPDNPCYCLLPILMAATDRSRRLLLFKFINLYLHFHHPQATN